MTELSLATEDKYGNQFPITDAIIKGWSSHYGEDGSGFGYLRFELVRPTGFTYYDIALGNRATLVKGPACVLFDGLIRQVDETSNSEGGDRISVTALGWIVVAGDDELLSHYCDKRLSFWKPRHGEQPSGSYRPDKFTYGTNNTGVYIHCNNGTAFDETDEFSLWYKFHSKAGDPFSELATRIKCDLTVMLGRGSLFESTINAAAFYGEVNTVNDGTDTITYKNGYNVGTVKAGDTLLNTTRDQSYSIVSITYETYTIVLQGGADLSTWVMDDRIELVEGKIGYVDVSWDTYVQPGQILYNLDQSKQATIVAIDKTVNLIMTAERATVAGWEIGERIFVAGPAFWAIVANVNGAVVTYASDVGEANIADGWSIINVTKKHAAVVQSHNTGANTITVTDSEDVETWEQYDVLQIHNSLFYAKQDGAPSGKWITFKQKLGLWMVQDAIGWYVWNQTRDDVKFLTQWDVDNNKFELTETPAGWSDNDVLRIFAPFEVTILAGDGYEVWPPVDGEGGIMQMNTVVNVTDPSPSQSHFRIRVKNYIAGEADEACFVQLKNLRVYNTSATITRKFLFERIVAMLHEHGLSDEVWDISGLYMDSVLLEPLVFEFVTPADAMTWLCGLGDGGDLFGRIAWGVRMNLDRRLFLEQQDLSRIDYVVRRVSRYDFSLGVSLEDSAQKLQGIYNNVDGEQQFTQWQEASEQYFGENLAHFIRRRIRLDSIDNEIDADNAVTLKLLEMKYPGRRSSYRIEDGAIFDAHGGPVPFDEVKASGGLVRVEDWRSAVNTRNVEYGKLDDWTTDQIVAVEVDYQARTVTLTPAGAKGSFERYMANIARLAERD